MRHERSFGRPYSSRGLNVLVRRHFQPGAGSAAQDVPPRRDVAISQVHQRKLHAIDICQCPMRRPRIFDIQVRRCVSRNPQSSHESLRSPPQYTHQQIRMLLRFRDVWRFAFRFFGRLLIIRWRARSTSIWRFARRFGHPFRRFRILTEIGHGIRRNRKKGIGLDTVSTKPIISHCFVSVLQISVWL